MSSYLIKNGAKIPFLSDSGAFVAEKSLFLWKVNGKNEVVKVVRVVISRMAA